MTEELKAKWLRSIHRQDYIVNKNSRVCIKHFPENFIIREDKAVTTDGTVAVVPRQRLKLPDDAYATIFLDQPSYITKILPAKRKNPETCLDKLDELLKDKSWKRIASILRPIATHHDHIVNKAHRLAMMMNYDAVAEQNSRLFLVHSQSKIDFYQIEILENDCNCRTMKYPIFFVPRCRSNYDKNDHVTVFRFPMNEEELKARWLRSIHRQDYIVNKNSRVCIKHFP
jgi:hypothetical protein